MKSSLFLFALFLVLTSAYDLTPILNKLKTIPKTWTAGINAKFNSMTENQVMAMMGTLPVDPKDRLPTKEIQPLENIPEQFDSREFWSRCESIKEIRDQSQCGSCWAFGAVEAMSDRICIASGQRQQTRLSTRDLLSCCGQLTCGFGCNGGNPHGAWKHFKSAGIVEQKCQPYPFPHCDHHVSGQYQPCSKIQPTPKCEKQCVTSELVYKDDLHFGKLIYSVPSKQSEIQTEILTNGPVEASFNVHEDFLTYKSGVYQHVEGKNLGGHSIKILGWGVENNTPYWLVANSWNEDWGDKGFFKIKRGSNECGIEKEVIAGIPVVQSFLQVE